MKKNFYFTLNKKKIFSYTGADIAALAVFLMLGLWFIYVIPRGVNVSDESFYYTIPQRLTMGDRLFVDEWQVSQLTSLFHYFPYRFFLFITGSNEGIILFMRALAVVIALFMYWLVYIKLREYGLWGMMVAFLLSVYFPAGVLALSYYTIPVYAMMVVCLMLFLSKKELRLWQLSLVGLSLACAVLAQPVFVVMYFFFSVLCLVRTKKEVFLQKYSFVLNSRVWKGLTIGCLISFKLPTPLAFYRCGI